MTKGEENPGGEGAPFGGETSRILASASYTCSNVDCFFNTTSLEIIECKCETPDYDIKVVEPENKIEIWYRCKVCGIPFIITHDKERLEIFRRYDEWERSRQ